MTAPRSKSGRAVSDHYDALAAQQTVNKKLRMAEHLMQGIVLDLVDLLRDDHSVDFSGAEGSDRYRLLLGLPLLRQAIELEILAKDGHPGCVDKTFAELTRRMRE